ncbi:MAG: holo-ACP synthase [Oscillospiraceae bacterium]|nr:holo-ACP synthase [Oscillospiraceae bacterium]
MDIGMGMQVRCGTDIIDIKRIKHSIDSNGRFAQKVYTDAEIAYCDSKSAGRYASYAARFAAKEAFLKALGAGLYNGAALTEIEVVNDAATGEPALQLYGGACSLYNQKGGISLSVSLSHTAEAALATVVMLCANIQRDDGEDK